MKSQGVKHLHSPFVYDLVNDVIYNRTPCEDYKKIDEVRHGYKRNKNTIELIDFGAGAKMQSYANYYIRIDKLARKTSQPAPYAHLLYRVVKKFQPHHILELGTSLGVSALSFALASPQGQITTIEGSANVAALANESFSKLGLENIDIIIGNFDHVLPRFLKKNKQIDFVFFDGNHRKDKTIDYFEQCLPHTNNDTVFLFDDIHWSAGMEEAWEYIKASQKVKVTIDLFFMGLVFFRKELSKQDFIIRY